MKHRSSPFPHGAERAADGEKGRATSVSVPEGRSGSGKAEEGSRVNFWFGGAGGGCVTIPAAERQKLSVSSLHPHASTPIGGCVLRVNLLSQDVSAVLHPAFRVPGPKH
jgi:hypothetical protein